MAKASDTQVGGSHYKDMGEFQPWDVLKHWLTPEEYRGYQKGVAIAYLARERSKGGEQDIAKAAHHLQKLLEVLADKPLHGPLEYAGLQPADVAAEVCCGNYDSCTKPCVPRALQKADADGWIAHDGGECPVPNGVRVRVRLREGSEHDGRALVDLGLLAAQWRSDEYPDSLTIVAYKIIT